ncbi:MAG TPA: hypothetical protein VFQ72_03225 [Candidatus Paceibacterota bacterium]|nr:hypothetical protein [Candidatus Paceibacterota bacterium]
MRSIQDYFLGGMEREHPIPRYSILLFREKSDLFCEAMRSAHRLSSSLNVATTHSPIFLACRFSEKGGACLGELEVTIGLHREVEISFMEAELGKHIVEEPV